MTKGKLNFKLRMKLKFKFTQNSIWTSKLTESWSCSWRWLKVEVKNEVELIVDTKVEDEYEVDSNFKSMVKLTGIFS